MKQLDGVTKALTLHQPYATLIAAGIKHWETRYNPPGGPMCPAGTRPLPGLPVEPGERVAVHAAKTDTALYQFGNDDVPGLHRDGHIGVCDLWHRDAGPNWSILFPDRRDWFPLPFGAIVGTAVVAEVLPIFGMERIYDRPDRPPESAVPYIWYGLKESDTYGATPLIGLDVERDAAQEDVSDQLPYGYWEAGRWAWRMTDPVMFDAPVPCRGAQGVWRIPAQVTA